MTVERYTPISMWTTVKWGDSPVGRKSSGGSTVYQSATTNNDYMDDKIIAKITEHIKEIENSDVLRNDPTDIAINAPLALMQCDAEGQLKALRWVMEGMAETPQE